jgi:hypothetical protein
VKGELGLLEKKKNSLCVRQSRIFKWKKIGTRGAISATVTHLRDQYNKEIFTLAHI